MADANDKASTRFLVGLALLLLAGLALGARSLDVPGLYYDEAVQARPAKEFVRGSVHATAFPGSSTIELAGRPFPWMTQPYMGALKSQALIPSLWLFGAETTVLRASTLIWALLGVAGIVCFARRAFGEPTALLTGALLVSDPSLLLLARHDWGSFALSLLLRGAALWSCWRWWETRRSVSLFAGALALGLGFYNKVDFAVFLTAAATGVLACGAGPLLARVRETPRAVGVAAFGFLLGAALLLPSLASVLVARNAFASPDESGEKLRTLWTMLDASYFERLMEVGGLFDRMADAQATSGPLGLLFAVALASLIAVSIARWSLLDRASRAAVLFLTAGSAAALAAYAALPGGVRIHHALNIYPFPHLLIAWTAARVASRGRIAQLAVLGALTLVVALQLNVLRATLDSVRATGGKGRWSDSIEELARELDSHDGSQVVVSMDWGFHETLGFLTDEPRLVEAYPRIPAAVGQRGVWSLEGGVAHVYLLHEAPYDLFGYGDAFLRAASALDPELVTLRRYSDREGELSFVSVTIRAPHQILFTPRTGFRIRLL